MNEFLIDDELFGNEAGEDEQIDVLASYFVEKQEFSKFYSHHNKFRIVMSRKGVGKSALLRRTFYEKENKDGIIALYIKGADLVALKASDDLSPYALLNDWQQRICTRVSHEIGKRTKIALSGDFINLVESSELAGFKGKNLAGMLLERLKIKFNPAEITSKVVHPDNRVELLKRITTDNKFSIWVFVDDVDATFINNETNKLMVSTFFSACRALVNDVDGLYMRVSVRTDVWSIIRQFDESLDKCVQYITEIKWSTLETGHILKNKIVSYFQRKSPEKEYAELSTDRDRVSNPLGLVFSNTFEWGGRRIEPFRPIHILSNGRPRWAAQLCKMAGITAYSRNKNRIFINDISVNLDEYGSARLDDIYREHRHQCEKIIFLVETFSNKNKVYTTENLLKHILLNVIKKLGKFEIDGNPYNDSVQIANFVFRIGLIQARDLGAKTGLEFVRFEDRPNLLVNTSNLDDGLDWSVHPSFWNVLRIQG